MPAEPQGPPTASHAACKSQVPGGGLNASRASRLPPKILTRCMQGHGINCKTLVRSCAPPGMTRQCFLWPSTYCIRGHGLKASPQLLALLTSSTCQSKVWIAQIATGVSAS
eukprot:scaffold155454_cov22-Tisochrysis_lutea.AAC.1